MLEYSFGIEKMWHVFEGTSNKVKILFRSFVSLVIDQTSVGSLADARVVEWNMKS